jgi:predicted dehydrogenase
MIHVAILGSGFGTEVYAQAFQSNSIYRLQAIFDKDLKNAKEAKRNFGFREAYDSWQDALSDKHVTMAIIAAPPATHFEMAKYALERGLHVLISAPFCMDAKAGEELSKLAVSKNVVAVVDHHLNFLPIRRFAIDLLKNGKIGVLHSIDRVFRSKESISETVKPESTWKSARVLGGGLLNELGAHDFDFLLRAVGGVHTVSAHLSTHIKQRETSEGEVVHVTVEDGYQATLAFHSGAVATINASSASPMKDVNEFSFHGSIGTLFIQNDAELIFYGRNGAKERLAIPPNYHLTSVPGNKLCTPVYAMSESMASAIYNKTIISPTFDEALHSLRITDSIRISSEEKRWTEIGSEKQAESVPAKNLVSVGKIF